MFETPCISRAQCSDNQSTMLHANVKAEWITRLINIAVNVRMHSYKELYSNIYMNHILVLQMAFGVSTHCFIF